MGNDVSVMFEDHLRHRRGPLRVTDDTRDILGLRRATGVGHADRCAGRRMAQFWKYGGAVGQGRPRGIEDAAATATVAAATGFLLAVCSPSLWGFPISHVQDANVSSPGAKHMPLAQGKQVLLAGM